MIWLQYDDPENDNFGEFLKHIYPDDKYGEALEHYEELLREDWRRTRILFENDDDPKDWVIIQADPK